ncbi:hypothetical protein TNCV_665851 [Trichonephila clavipes]|uniref:Uncharacterized protein n=1 Tax=Trichonephila clavipes TaxID=2585209 RepID=A0A8X6SG28_TRICX|nr:hypothetical protein TNCV_665851 [Trichonephila clavipes]
MNSFLKAHFQPPIKDHLHSRCLLHSHWTSTFEVTPSCSNPSLQHQEHQSTRKRVEGCWRSLGTSTQNQQQNLACYKETLRKEKKNLLSRQTTSLDIKITLRICCKVRRQQFCAEVEAGVIFNMFAIPTISSRQTIVNKYLQNNKGINWNGLTIDDPVVEVWWSTSLDMSSFLGVIKYLK